MEYCTLDCALETPDHTLHTPHIALERLERPAPAGREVSTLQAVVQSLSAELARRAASEGPSEHLSLCPEVALRTPDPTLSPWVRWHAGPPLQV